MRRTRKSTKVGRLLAKMESSQGSVTIEGKKWKSYGDYVEDLDVTVEEIDRSKFDGIIDKYAKKINASDDDSISEIVDKLSETVRNQLIQELMHLHYDSEES